MTPTGSTRTSTARRGWLIGGAAAIVVAALVVALFVALEPVPLPVERSATPVVGETVTPGILATLPPIRPRFDKSARSIDDPNSIWVVVNKLRPLDPKNYVP